MFSSTGDTALVLLVPEAEPLVKSWRVAHDPSAAEGMPAHFTVLYPFISEGALNDDTLNHLGKIGGEWPPIAVVFNEFGRFPTVLWLKPDATSLAEIITRVHHRWPECLPYGRSDLAVIPHLTITDGANDLVVAQSRAEISRHLPLKATISSIALMAFDGNRWVCRHAFTLGGKTNGDLHAPRSS
jgi:2'-5' RNA ligase